MVKEKRDFLKDMPFSGKMTVIYIVCVIVPMTILSIFYYFSTTNKVNERNAKEVDNSVLNVKSSIQAIMDRVSFISDLLYYDEDIYDILYMHEGDGKSRIGSSEELDSKMLSFVISGSLESIDIYSSNDYLYRSSSLKKISDAKNDDWLYDFIESDKNTSVITYYDNSLKQYRVSMLRKMDKRKNDDLTNIMKLNLSLADIARELSIYSEKSDIYLVKDNKVIASRNYSESLPELKYRVGDEIDTNDKNIISRSLDFPSDYKIVAFYYPQKINDMFGAETIAFIALIFVILFVSSIAIFVITRSHAARLNKLTECALKIQNEVFETVDDKDMGRDEMGTLTRGINNAIVKINLLINQVYKEQIKNAEIEKAEYRAKLSSLQGQVNPHFMFNIFEIMRMKALKKRDKELAKILKEISKMFRCLISWNEDMITVEEEMFFVNAFIDVQSYTLDDEVLIDISVDESAKRCYIPKMSVQIFVENAFLHGLESRSDDKRFSLKIYLSEENLCVEVCDNGEGFDKEFVDAINSGRIEQYSKNKGVGIKNVITRLSLYFDNEFKICVSSVPYEKTQIKLTLPIKYE